MKTFLPLLLSLFVFTTAFSQKLTMQRQYLSIVVDASYSMTNNLGEASKIAQTQKHLAEFIGKLENYGELQLSLSTFGSNSSNTGDNRCTDFKTIVPFELGNTPKLKAQLKRITAQGGSPVSLSLQKSAELIPASGTKKYIILIVDGGDACQQPFAETYEKYKSQVDGIFVIGLGIAKEDQTLYTCCPTFANADSGVELKQSLNRIFESIKPY